VSVRFTVEPHDNIPDCTKTHTLKTAFPISLPGVKKLLHNINTHKTCGPDNISGRILKELKEQTAPVLILILIFKRILSIQTRNIVRWYWIRALMGERFNELPTPHLSFTALVITLMMYSAFTKVDCQTLVQHMKMSVISLNLVQINILHHGGMFCKCR